VESHLSKSAKGGAPGFSNSAATRFVTCRSDEVVGCTRRGWRKLVPLRHCDFTMFPAARSDFLILARARRFAPRGEILWFWHTGLHSAPKLGLALWVYTCGESFFDSPAKNGIGVPLGLFALLATDRPRFVTVIASVVFFPRAPVRECAAELGYLTLAHCSPQKGGRITPPLIFPCTVSAGKSFMITFFPPHSSADRSPQTI
jgi:hypothetical protein